MFLNFRLKVRDFFRRNKKKIYIAVIAFIVIIVLNWAIGKVQEVQLPEVNYEPHTPIISGNTAPQVIQNNAEDKIEEYFNYCNEKDYENAYKMISDDCKEIKFKNDIENFKIYIDYIFNGNKIYSIQNYSNKDNVYIYKVTISADIMATGMNTEDSQSIYEEKIVLTKENEDVKFAVAGFIKVEDMDIVAEDDYMKIVVSKKITYYDKVCFQVQLKNKTTYPIVIANQTESNEVLLSLNGDYRSMIIDNYGNNKIISRVGLKNIYEIEFSKFFDENREETSLIFDKIKVLKEYTGIEENWEEELKNAIKLYSLQVTLQ